MNEKLILIVDDDRKNLAMSAYHEYASGAPRADLAADDFLKKPFTRENLLRKVRDLLGRERQA